MRASSRSKTFAAVPERVLSVGFCVLLLLVAVASATSGGDRLTALLVAGFPFLFFVYRFSRMGVAVSANEVVVRNWVRTFRGRPDEVVSVGMEGRWYLKQGHLAVLRLTSGKTVACIGLSGEAKRTDEKVTELAALLGVSRVDRRGDTSGSTA